jgi:hypothetical protein
MDQHCWIPQISTTTLNSYIKKKWGIWEKTDKSSMSCKKTKTGRESPFCKLECLASLAPDCTDIKYSYWWQHLMCKNKENSLQNANWQFCCTKWRDMKTERASRPSIQEANSENTMSFTVIWGTCDLTDYNCYWRDTNHGKYITQQRPASSTVASETEYWYWNASPATCSKVPHTG